jgi:hypothetical protein
MDVELGSIEELEPNIWLIRGLEDDLHFVIIDFLPLGIRGRYLRVFGFEGENLEEAQRVLCLRICRSFEVGNK